MRYPLWAFFFVLILPPYAAHALLAGKAKMVARVQIEEVVQPSTSAWQHTVTSRKSGPAP
jgi:hypothetical protein